MANIPKIKLPNQPSEAELDGFLSKVDEIGAVLKGLNSDDEEKRDLSQKQADILIDKIQKEKKNDEAKEDTDDSDMPKTKFGFSKTNINKEAYKTQTVPPQPAALPAPANPGENFDQNAFMAAMEADAKERALDKKRRVKIAMDLKEKGNIEFRQGNYEKALELYDQAFVEIRDELSLYTNRAQTRIKLGMYTEALTDCHWALRLTPGCMKALVQQGHAYLALKEYDKARESYREILQTNPQKEAFVNSYLAEVDRAEVAHQAEVKATQLFESGQESATNLVDVIGRVCKPDHLPLFYSGGFRVVTNLLLGVDAQTLFRTHKGLQFPHEHPVLKRCLSASPVSWSREDKDVVSAALEMFTAACKDNETSQQKLMQQPGFPEQLVTLLEAKVKSQGRILRSSCLDLLHEVSLTEAGRTEIVGKFDVHRLMSALLPLMLKPAPYSDTAAAVLNNIALEKRVKNLLRDNIEIKILPEFENILQNNKISASIVCLAASSVTNLAGDSIIRNKMAARPALWDISATLVVSYLEGKLLSGLESVSGLLLNLSTGVDATHLSQASQEVTSACYSVMSLEAASDVAVVRCLGVISNLLPCNQQARTYLSQRDRVLAILTVLKCGDPLKEKSALKSMAALTKDSADVREIVAENKGTSIFANYLTSNEETTIGNAALCLSHLSNTPKVASKLTKTNIIQKLLVLARDSHQPTVQSNCAILIGKLVQADTRHLERLRELHGIEILTHCMKHVK